MAARNHCAGIAKLEPPEWALRELREIDPSADLHYIGDGRWAAGSVKPNAVRRGIAGRMKRTLERNGARSLGQLQIATIAYQGFAFVGVYEGSKFWAAQKAIADFRRRDWNYRHRAEEAFMEALEESEKPLHGSLTSGETDLVEAIQYRTKHASPELFRGRKHFPQPGVA